MDNHLEGDGSLRAEKEEEEKTKQHRKQDKATAEQEKKLKLPKLKPENNASGATGKKRRKASKVETEEARCEDFLKNEPSPAAVTRDTIETISRGVTLRDTRKIITYLPPFGEVQYDTEFLRAGQTGPISYREFGRDD